MVEASEPKKSGKLEEDTAAVGVEEALGKIKVIRQDFITEVKSWDDEDFKIDEDLQKGITEGLGFSKPSRIQKHAIPMIAADPFKNLVAQSKNGSGKTGAFMIGSCIRVDRKENGIQVIVIANSQIMATQIAGLYKKLTQFTNIKVVDVPAEGNVDGQVLITTVGKLCQHLGGRKKVNLDKMKAVVFDEADSYFIEDATVEQIKVKIVAKLPKEVQYIFFSATFDDENKDKICDFVKESQSISLKKEALSLDNIVQFRADLPEKKKVDFLARLHECCSITQCIVFVNTRKFAITVQKLMKERGLKANIVFGKGMEDEERQKVIQKFREQSINFLITTDLISRGFDVSTVKLVVNFDVPGFRENPDAPTYLHRIGRGGRFGTKAVAVTLIDRPLDKKMMDEIVDYYSMQDKVQQLENPEVVSRLLKQFVEEEQGDDN